MGEPVERSGASSARRRCGLPTNCPETWIVGEPPPEPRLQTENSASGACGAQSSHAAIAAGACAHGHPTLKVVTVEIGAVRKRYCVAIPKLPPPPPRLAQYRSAFSCRRAGPHPAVGGHEREREEVVARRAELTGQEADAAAERLAADPDRRARPGRNRDLVLPEPDVDVDQLCARPDDRLVPGPGGHLGHPGHVHHDPAGHRGVAAVAVAATAGRYADPVPTRPGQGLRDVRGGLAVHDGERPVRVEARVVEPARRVVAGARAADDRACDLPLQLAERRRQPSGHTTARRKDEQPGTGEELPAVERPHRPKA